MFNTRAGKRRDEQREKGCSTPVQEREGMRRSCDGGGARVENSAAQAKTEKLFRGKKLCWIYTLVTTKSVHTRRTENFQGKVFQIHSDMRVVGDSERSDCKKNFDGGSSMGAFGKIRLESERSAFEGQDCVNTSD